LGCNFESLAYHICVDVLTLLKILSREAGCPKVRISVVGAGTGELFQNVEEGSDLLDVAFTPSKGMYLCCKFVVFFLSLMLQIHCQQ